MSKKFNLKDFIAKIKPEYLLVIALAVVAIFIFSSSFKGEEKVSTNVDSYVDNLENKLKNSLSKVRGAGKVDVIISVNGGMQSVYATEKQTSSGDVKETLVFANGKTVVLKENYPEILGVVVVAQGANNLTVKIALLNATCVYLNIPDEKVEILSMK